MTRCGWPRRRFWWMAAMTTMGNAAGAGVWVTEPVLGLAADYSSNPGLLLTDRTAETRAALLIDAPTTYHAADISLSLQPSVRISDQSGYSSVTSDYEHLNIKGEIDSELDVFTARAQLSRDSSLYYNYQFDGSTGVRRDSTLGDLSWAHSFTERLKLNVDVNSSRVQYGESAGLATLTDYRYSTLDSSIAWNAGELTTLTADANIGAYDSFDETTKSVNTDLEFGIVRQLTELWSVNATAGYSRENNAISLYYGPFLLGSFKATNTGTVFAANLTRQTERLALTANASRSLVPTGFSFLSLQTSYQLGFHYPRTERWSFDGHVRRLQSSEPQVSGPSVNQSFLDVGFSAAWLITEKWTLTFGASKLNARYAPPPVQVAATGFTLELSRSFNPITWH